MPGDRRRAQRARRRRRRRHPRRRRRRWPECPTSCARCTPSPASPTRSARSTVTLRRGRAAWCSTYVREHVPDAARRPARRQLDRHRPRLHRPRHARARRTTCTTAWSTSAPSRSCARRWFPRVFYAKPEKGLAHRALADIEESIRELAYYRGTLFVAPPGPTHRGGPGRRREAARRWPIPASADDRRGWHAKLIRHAGSPGAHGGCSSAGRAPGCGPGGRGFKSRHSPHVAAHPAARLRIDVC